MNGNGRNEVVCVSHVERDESYDTKNHSGMDLNRDGDLEIVVPTFRAGCFVYTVLGSSENMLLWPAVRANYLRQGRPWKGSSGRRSFVPVWLLLN